MGESGRLSQILNHRIAATFVLLAIAIVLYLQIIGTGAGLSYSLGRPVLDSYAKIPILFVRVTSALVSSLPILSFCLLAGGLLTGALTYSFEKASITQCQPVPENGGSPKRDFLEFGLLALAVSLATVLIWLPRTIQSLPIGSDTLYYMSVVDTMKKEGPLWAVQYTDKPLLYTTLYVAEMISSLSTADLFRILPVVLGIGATTGAWYLGGAIYKPGSGFAALATALSISLMRTSIDLYASFFALVVLSFALGMYFRHRDHIRAYQKFGLMLTLVVLVMLYWFVWIFVLVLLAASEIVYDGKKHLRLLIELFSPSLAVLGLFVAVSLSYPPPIYWGLGSSFSVYLGRSITPLGIVTSNVDSVSGSSLNLLGQDNLILPILAAIGFILLKPRTFPIRTTYIWGTIMLGFTLVSSTGTHAALLFPLPILAGLGMRKALELV